MSNDIYGSWPEKLLCWWNNNFTMAKAVSTHLNIICNLHFCIMSTAWNPSHLILSVLIRLWQKIVCFVLSPWLLDLVDSCTGLWKEQLLKTAKIQPYFFSLRVISACYIFYLIVELLHTLNKICKNIEQRWSSVKIVCNRRKRT